MMAKIHIVLLEAPWGKRKRDSSPQLLCIGGPSGLGMPGPWAGSVKDPLPAIPDMGMIRPTEAPRPGLKPGLAPAHPNSGESRGPAYKTSCENRVSYYSLFLKNREERPPHKCWRAWT